MNNFIILFYERTGSTAIIQTLHNIENIHIIRHMHKKSYDKPRWEPFDKHNFSPNSGEEFKKILNFIYQGKSIDKINGLYRQYNSQGSLYEINYNNSIGFKIRPSHYLKEIAEICARNNIIIFMLFRNDILRQALSGYYGDGNKQGAHLQFLLGSEKISQDDIKPIQVKIDEIDKYITLYKHKWEFHRKLYVKYKKLGLAVYPIFYEDFLNDKKSFFQNILEKIKVNITEDLLNQSLSKDIYLKKVHSQDISKIALNHKEIEQKYGNSFIYENNKALRIMS